MRPLAFSLVLFLAWATAAQAVIVKSGPAIGKPLANFDAIKCGGAPDDGIPVGNPLSVVYKYRDLPVVLLFATLIDDKLIDLVKKLDEAAKEQSEAKLAVVVCILGPTRQEAEANAKALAAKQPTPHVAVTIPTQFEKGPPDYALNPKADITVLVVADNKIVANYGGDIHEGSVTKILGDVTRTARNVLSKINKGKPGGKDAATKSGPQPDISIPTFVIEKVGGRPSDGIPPGAQISYRDRYQGRPLVVVFARTADEQLASLVKELNDVVANDATKQFRAFVNILGDSREAAFATAKEFAAKNSVAHVPVVVPIDFQTGPPQYNLNPNIDTTVLVCIETWVRSNFAGEIDETMIKGVLQGIARLPAERATLRANQERYRRFNRQPEPPFKPGFAYAWYEGVKIGGAPSDGVEAGANINYLKRYNEPDYQGPSIVVHARNGSEQLAGFVAKLDQAMTKHAEKRLHAIVNFIGDDLEKLKGVAKAFAEEHPTQGVPIVVPIEHENGPELHMLDVKDEVTVIAGDFFGNQPKLYRGFKPGTLTDRAGEKLIEEIVKLVITTTN